MAGKCIVLFLELTRRQEDLRRIDERRSQDFDRRRQMIPMNHSDAYYPAMENPYHSNQAAAASAALPYNDFAQGPYANANPYMQPSASMAPTFDAAYTTHQVAHGHDYNQQMQGHSRKRGRYWFREFCQRFFLLLLPASTNHFNRLSPSLGTLVACLCVVSLSL